MRIKLKGSYQHCIEKVCIFYETDYDVVYIISVNWRCRVKSMEKCV
ncbi:hypothetical protein MITS9509_02703 [Synechococcus sp. MIT S9509]|nr:hypothetical protein MITS9509_02703 [Synechococcus sp. MIT S9509]